MRAKETSKIRARVRTESVLAVPGTPSSSTWPPARTATTSISASSSCPTMALRISARMRSANCCAVCGGPEGAVISLKTPAEAGVSNSACPLLVSDKMESPPHRFDLLDQAQHLRLTDPLARHDRNTG